MQMHLPSIHVQKEVLMGATLNDQDEERDKTKQHESYDCEKGVEVHTKRVDVDMEIREDVTLA